MSTFRNSFGIPLQTLRETWPLNNRGLSVYTSILFETT